jgi:16S rRNA G1207 methylase RsmC
MRAASSFVLCRLRPRTLEHDLTLPVRRWRAVALGGQTIAIPDESLCVADADDPANRLLAENAALHAGDRVLVLGVGCGLLAAWAAARTAPGRLILSDTHSALLDRASATLSHNGRAGYELLPAERLNDLAAGTLDTALANSAFQSSSKALAAALWAAGRALRPGGRLYVAGAKAQGIGAIKSRMAEIFGASGTLGYRKGVHVVVATRPERWDELDAGPSEATEIVVRGHAFRLALRDGVFARGGLDAGTRMLLEAIDVRPGDRALDLGCGGGIVGMLIARLAPQGHVDLVDSDTAAVALARENLRWRWCERGARRALRPDRKQPAFPPRPPPDNRDRPPVHRRGGPRAAPRRPLLPRRQPLPALRARRRGCFRECERDSRRHPV